MRFACTRHNSIPIHYSTRLKVFNVPDIDWHILLVSYICIIRNLSIRHLMHSWRKIAVNHCMYMISALSMTIGLLSEIQIDIECMMNDPIVRATPIRASTQLGKFWVWIYTSNLLTWDDVRPFNRYVELSTPYKGGARHFFGEICQIGQDFRQMAWQFQ